MAKKPTGAKPAAGSSPGPNPAAGGQRPSKGERLAAQRRAENMRRWRNRAIAAVAAIAIVAGITLNVAASRARRDDLARDLTATGCRYDRSSDPGSTHVAGATYRVNPPTGGDHDPSPSPARAYNEADVPTDPHVVHSLEHGFVALWYRPDLPTDKLAQLEAIQNRFDNDVLLLPRPGLPTPIAATAWHQRLQCDQPAETTLTRFVTAFANKGPERVPH